MTISGKQILSYLTMIYFISFSFAFSGFLLISNYKSYTQHSYLSGLFSRFNFFAVALMFVAPAFEELGFRAFLTKNRYLFIAGFSMFLTYIEASIYYRFITKLKILHTPYAVIVGYEKIIYFMPENIILLLVIIFGFKIDLASFIMKYKYRLVFVSSIFFALSHTTGLWAASVPWYFPIFFVIPQFWAGVLLSLIRMKYNLISSVTVHFCFDFSLLIVISAAKSTGFIPVVHIMFIAFSIITLFGFYACGFFNFIFLIRNRGSSLLTEIG